MSENLGQLEITIGADIARKIPLLTGHQQDLVRHLVIKAIARGGWAGKAIARTLEEEMYHTARHMGGETWEQIDDLLKGIWISVQIAKPAESET